MRFVIYLLDKIYFIKIWVFHFYSNSFLCYTLIKNGLRCSMVLSYGLRLIKEKKMSEIICKVLLYPNLHVARGVIFCKIWMVGIGVGRRF
jgi:hypothetical protein